MSEIQDRIGGTEMEYSVFVKLEDFDHYTLLGDGCWSAVTDFTRHPYLDPGLQVREDMLTNGGKLYQDQGRAEYATPEDTSFAGTVANEIAGERIITGNLARYVQAHPNIESAYVIKRVLFEERTSPDKPDGRLTTGYHPNLSVDAKALRKYSGNGTLFTDGAMHLQALHLASSSPLFGQGAIYQDEDRNFVYSFGQKTVGVNCDYSTSTTDRKPVINQRNESLTGKDEAQNLARGHITCTDPSISPWSAEMLPGTCSLVFRAIEQGRGQDLRIVERQPAYDSSSTRISDLYKQLSGDITQTTKVELADGRTITPNDLQYEIVSIAESTEHTDQEAGILEEWKRAVGDLGHDIRSLRDRSDAIAKLDLIRKFAAKNDIDEDDLGHDLLRSFDKQYDIIAKVNQENAGSDDLSVFYGPTIAHKLRRSVFSSHMPSEEAIEHAMFEPPTTTRAAVRAQLIKNNPTTSAKWDSVTLRRDDNVVCVVLPDPYNSTDAFTQSGTPVDLGPDLSTLPDLK